MWTDSRIRASSSSRNFDRPIFEGAGNPWKEAPNKCRNEAVEGMSQLTKEATQITNLEEAVYFLKGSGTHTNGLAQIDPRIIVLLGVVANCWST